MIPLISGKISELFIWDTVEFHADLISTVEEQRLLVICSNFLNKTFAQRPKVINAKKLNIAGAYKATHSRADHSFEGLSSSHWTYSNKSITNPITIRIGVKAHKAIIVKHKHLPVL